jgi:sec-independent protein translocase protein TatA
MINTLLFIGGLGGLEITLIVLVVLLLFGGKKIPELMRGVGKGIKEFKSGIKEDDEDSSGKEIDEKSKESSDKN